MIRIADWNCIAFRQQSRRLLLRGGAAPGKCFAADRVASVLGERGGWQSFRTVSSRRGGCCSRWRRKQGAAARAGNPAAARLYPGAQDQADYWIEVISAPSGGGRQIREKRFRSLLVSSTRSAELVTMLRWALLKWAGVRSQQITIACGNTFYCVPRATTLRWWILRRAGQSGRRGRRYPVALLLVVEALPLEQWRRRCRHPVVDI